MPSILVKCSLKTGSDFCGIDKSSTVEFLSTVAKEF